MKKIASFVLLSASMLTLAACGGNNSQNTPVSSYVEPVISSTPASTSSVKPSSTKPSSTATSNTGSNSYNITDGVYFVVIADYSGTSVAYNKAVPLNGENYPEITNLENFTAQLQGRNVQVGDCLKVSGNVQYENGKYSSGTTFFNTNIKTEFKYNSSTGKFSYKGTDDADFWNKLPDVTGLKYVISSDGSFSEISKLADQTTVKFAVPVSWVSTYSKNTSATYDAKFIGIYA